MDNIFEREIEQLFVINKYFLVGEKKQFALCLTVSQGRAKLWALGALPKLTKPAREPENNREAMRFHYEMEDVYHDSLKELRIYGQSFQVLGFSSYGTLDIPEAGQRMEYFGQHGCQIPDASDQQILMEHHMELEGKAIDVSLEMDFSVVARTIPRHHFANEVFCLPIGGNLSGLEAIVKHVLEPENGKWHTYKIHRLFAFDVREKYNLPESAYEHLPVEIRIRTMEERQKTIDSLCPEGHLLVVLEYEAEEINLNFYSTDYLESDYGESDGDGPFGLIFGGVKGDENAPQMRYQHLGHVPKGFEGDFYFELIGWSMKERD